MKDGISRSWQTPVAYIATVGQEKEHPALRALVAAEEGKALVDRGGAEQVPRALRLGRA